MRVHHVHFKVSEIMPPTYDMYIQGAPETSCVQYWKI